MYVCVQKIMYVHNVRHMQLYIIYSIYIYVYNIICTCTHSLNWPVHNALDMSQHVFIYVHKQKSLNINFRVSLHFFEEKDNRHTDGRGRHSRAQNDVTIPYEECMQ